MRKKTALLFMVTILLFITACGNSGSGGSNASGGTDGKTLRIAWWDQTLDMNIHKKLLICIKSKIQV